jgi:hypothetical protein
MALKKHLCRTLQCHRVTELCFRNVGEWWRWLTGVITLLFQQSVSYKISRLLGKFNTKIVHVRDKKSLHMLRSVKGDLELKVSGLCNIPYGCGKVYIGQPGWSIEIGNREHAWDLHLCQPDRSAAMLGGFLVTMAWRVLRLRMEETASR